MLESHAGFEVVGEAGDGMEALALLAAAWPNVVLLDLNMPRMDGFQVLERLDGQRDQMHILVISSYEDEATRQAVLRLGAAAFLSKRALVNDLIQAIETAVTCPHPCDQLISR